MKEPNTKQSKITPKKFIINIRFLCKIGQGQLTEKDDK